MKMTTELCSWRSNKALTVFVSEPELVGYYSIDGDRNYLPDFSRLTYYNPPNSERVHLDLNKGIKSAVRNADCHKTGESIIHLFEWIKLNNRKILASETDKWINLNFVCSSGLLTKVLYTPYEPMEDWIICAAKYRGTIYLCRYETPEQLKIRANMPQHFTSWGYKFEQYMSSAHPDEAPDTSQPVVEPAEFRCVYQRRFGKYDVLFSAEMDCVSSKTVIKEPLDKKNLKFVELKTRKIINHPGQERTFRKFNLVKWWAQCFVSGIEEVLCGFRDDNGIVRQLKSYSVEQMIDMGQCYWNPESCIRYCEKFLTEVASTVVNECNKTIYKFEKSQYGSIITSELPSTSEYAFMPSSFMATTG